MAQRLKHLPEMQETWVRSLGREDPWRRKWQPIPVLLPGKYRGLRSLVGYSPWGRKELDTTERLHFTNTLMELEHWLLCNKYLSGSELHFSSFYLIGPDEVRTDSVVLVSLYSTHWEKSIRENNVPD